MSVKSVVSKIKNAKHFEVILAVVAVIVMLIIYVSTLLPKKNSSTAVSTVGYCERMKIELTETVSALKGAGKTKVIVNWESGVESVIAYVSSSGGSTTTSTPQIITGSDGTKPIVLKEIYPKALGAIIICEGGDNVKVKLDIISAVSVLLDLTPENICVYPMEKQK